jgi:agmatinase
MSQWDHKNKNEQIQHLEKGLPAPSDAGIFGLSLSESDCDLVIIPAPWEATTSYGGGTSKTPQRIIEASHQLDLFDLSFGEPFKSGICLAKDCEEIAKLNVEAKKLSDPIRELNETLNSSESDKLNQMLSEANKLSSKVNDIIYNKSKSLIAQGKKVGLLGGDHSCPYGLLKALSEVHGEFAVVHVDAHFDFRVAYEGFEHSHASIMYNATKDFKEISKIYQIGIRDFSRDEYDYQKSLEQSGRSLVHFSSDVFKRCLSPNGLKNLFEDINKFLPEKVYISFDIDGLDPKLCPGTGTPVPGGLEFDFAVALLESFKESGRTIVGFDLCEVSSPDGEEWDLNVGARILYKLCGLTLDLK